MTMKATISIFRCIRPLVLFVLCITLFFQQGSAQKQGFSIELNYGFQNLNRHPFNQFFSSFNSILQPLDPAGLLRTTSCHGIGFRPGLFIMSGRDKAGGYFQFALEYNYGAWKNEARFANQIEQHFKYKIHAYKFSTDVGVDLPFFFLALTAGFQVNAARLRVYNEYPTGNTGMSQDNPLNGFYKSSYISFPLGLRGGISFARKLRFPVSVEYTWPFNTNNVFLEDKSVEAGDSSPYIHKPFPAFADGTGNFTPKALQGWTIRFGVYFLLSATEF